MDLQHIIENNKRIVLNYSVKENDDRYQIFNGIYTLLYDKKPVANIEWSNNHVEDGLNNVIHGYLRPNIEEHGETPQGLFIGTNWFKTPNGLMVTNSLTTIFGMIFIVSIVVKGGDVKIILTNPNKKSKKSKN